MEPQFENRYYTNHKMLAEFMRKHGNGPRPWVAWVLVATFAYFVVSSWWHGILWDMLPTLLFMGCMFTLLYLLPHFYAWSLLRNAKKHHDGEQPETVVTFGDAIEIQEGMMRLTIEYRKIQKVVRLGHSYVLKNGKRNGILLTTDGFTKGTFAEFRQFLKEKRPDLQIPE